MENKKEKQFSVMDDEKFVDFFTEKFGKIDERFDGIDNEIKGLKEDNKGISDEVKGINQKIDGLGERLEFLINTSKRQFDDICERLDFVEKKLDSMGTMEKAILSEIKAIKDKMETKINHEEYLNLEKRVVKLEKLVFAK
ncbi:MAG: hypothetical protein PHU42_03700 [Patescibacteria group bacterium]|nr:hypothetical protein [Patescibacteria group bacterium]